MLLMIVFMLLVIVFEISYGLEWIRNTYRLFHLSYGFRVNIYYLGLLVIGSDKKMG